MNKMKYKSGGAKKKQLGGAGGYGMVMAQSELLKNKSKKKSASNESPRAKKQSTPQGSSAKNQEGSFIEPNKEVKFGGVKYQQGGEKKQSFNEAFAAARKAGKMTFEWNGKSYGTRRADETKSQQKSKMAARASGMAGKKWDADSKMQARLDAQRQARASKAKSAGSSDSSAKANTTSGRPNVGRPTQQGGNKKQPMSSMKSKSAGQISTGAKSVGLQKSSFTVPKVESKSDARKAKRADRKEGRKANRAAKSGSAVSRLLGSRKSMQTGGLKTPSEDQKGLQKLPTSVRNKMGYKKYGGKK